MAATPTHISAANTPFHTGLRPPSPPLSLRFTSLPVKCSNQVNNINGVAGKNSSELVKNGGRLKNMQSGIIDELLNRDENRVLLDGLDKATERVELAKKKLAEIEKQEIEARKMKEYINQLETRASEIAEIQNELSDARAMMEESGEDRDGAMYKNKEKLESIKAASISAIVGTLASLPISLTQVIDTSELILSTTITIISCALYGATFRYAIRRDLDDFHLKTGTCAAFGIVKGLAELDVSSRALDGAVGVSENVLIFLFAAAGLDFCFKMGILSPFPVEK